ADARQWNVAVADHDALAGGHGPGGEVADLHDGDPIASLPDVRVQPALAPGIVQLEHHAQPGRADVVDEVEGVGEGVQEAEVDAQLADGLDRDPHAEPLGVRQQVL